MTLRTPGEALNARSPSSAGPPPPSAYPLTLLTGERPPWRLALLPGEHQRWWRVVWSLESWQHAVLTQENNRGPARPPALLPGRPLGPDLRLCPGSGAPQAPGHSYTTSSPRTPNAWCLTKSSSFYFSWWLLCYYLTGRVSRGHISDYGIIL